MVNEIRDGHHLRGGLHLKFQQDPLVPIHQNSQENSPHTLQKKTYNCNKVVAKILELN